MFNMIAGLLKGIGGMQNSMMGMLNGGESAATPASPSPIAGQAYQAAGKSPFKAPSETDRLGQSVGMLGAQRTKGADKIGMQYANMGLTPPQLPDPMSMLAGNRNMTGMQQNQRNLPITQILNMLRGV